LTSALDGGEWLASRPGRFTPKGRATGAVWAPEPVWTLWSREKCLTFTGNRTPAVQLVAVPTELSRKGKLRKVCATEQIGVAVTVKRRSIPSSTEVFRGFLQLLQPDAGIVLGPKR
jgi:hypothetical protein